ncbi:DNA mismatch endonuclease Vsr [Kribbella sp. CWNU-51]
MDLPPAPSSAAVRDRFRRQRTRDTAPEVALRRQLYRQGLRYRVDYRPLRQHRWKVDVAFVGLRVAVYVDGCFWHSCPDHGLKPKSNSKWWREKLVHNVLRDRRADAALGEAGWEVVRVWEHEDPVVAARRVCEVVRTRKDQVRKSLAGEAAIEQ